jgi:hypothetical protein
LKSKSVFLLLGTATLMLAGLVLYIQERSRKPAIPSSVFAIAETDMEKLNSDARAGDCRSAYKIAQHHSYWTLQFDEAEIWLRIAAKCDDAPSKEALIALLLDKEYEAGVSAEIDRLLVELHKLDEKSAKRVSNVVTARRKDGR